MSEGTRLNRRRLTLALAAAGLWVGASRSRAFADTTPDQATPMARAPELTDLPQWAQVQKEVGRKALVIGIDDYLHAEDLTTPKHDAKIMVSALTRFGFQFTPVAPLANDRCALLEAIGAFRSSLKAGDMAVVYFSGHGVERHGVNYLVPANAKPTATSRLAGYRYLSLDYLIAEISRPKPGFLLVVLDACRTDPFAGVSDATSDSADIVRCPSAAPVAVTGNVTASPFTIVNNDPRADEPSPPTHGLATFANPPRGVVIAYSAAPGRPSASLRTGDIPEDGSLYTRALAKSLAPRRRVSWILDEANFELRRLAGDEQKPWRAIQTGGEVMFEASQSHLLEEQECWIGALTGAENSQQDALLNYLYHYPTGRFSTAARTQLDELTKGLLKSSDVSTLATVISKGQIYSGALRTPSTISVAGDLSKATASSRQALFSSDRFLGRRVTEQLAAGARVQVLEVDPKTGWARVQAESGAIGFIPKVVVQGLDASTKFALAFGGDEADATLNDPSVIDAAIALAKRTQSRIVVRVGRSGVTDPGRAAQVSYLRSIRLGSILKRNGIAPEQITVVSGPLDDVGADQAQLAVLQS